MSPSDMSLSPTVCSFAIRLINLDYFPSRATKGNRLYVEGVLPVRSSSETGLLIACKIET